jgi:beta-xylosidase
VTEDRAAILDLAHDGAALSQRLARESVTLLKNDGDRLPLAADVARIAVIGPHATLVDAAFPPYTYPEFAALTRAMFGGTQSSMVGAEDLNAFGFDAQFIQDEMGELLATPGEQLAAKLYGAVSLAEAISQQFPRAEVVTATGSGLLSGDELIDEAVQVAATADVVVLALGGRARWFFGERTEGEGADVSDTRLPPVQRKLAARIRDIGRPTVAVVFSGRPMALGDLAPNVDALLFGYQGAQFGTRAVAEVLAGAFAPRGRLPYSVPARPGQTPLHSGQRFGTGYRRAAGDPMGGYIDGPAAPLYAFGHGLSYTTFEYSDLALSTDTLEPGGTLAVRATVRNSGSRAGTETVQLYVEDVATGISRPALQLAGFQSVTLEPGESSQVEFLLDTAVLAYLDLPRERWILEPGPIRVRVGAASDDLRLEATVELVGAIADLSARRVFLTDSRSITN